MNRNFWYLFLGMCIHVNSPIFGNSRPFWNFGPFRTPKVLLGPWNAKILVQSNNDQWWKKSIFKKGQFCWCLFHMIWPHWSYNECKDFCAPAQGDCSAYYATTHQAPPDLQAELVHNGFVVEREGAEGVGAPLQFPSAVLLKSLWGQATLNHPAASALETRLQVAQEENSCENKMAVKFSYQEALLGCVTWT